MTGKSLTHRERLEVCFSGEIADRVPVSLWRHFPVDDQSPDTLAAAAAHFQNTYDFDFIKVTPSSSFCLKDWGVMDKWVGNSEGTREYQNAVVQRPEDWARLAVLHPSHGFMGDQLTCLRLLAGEFSPQTPIIQTVFSPLTQAKHLVDKNQMMVHMRCYPDAFHAGLEIITRSTIRFIEQVAKTGADGIFYAVQFAQSGLLSFDEFDEFGRSYDLRVLEAAKNMWFNLLHVHGENVMFNKVKDYPVQVINWHDRVSPPSLPEALRQINGAVCGGLRQWETMALGGPLQIRTEAADALQATEGKRFILGTGCVAPIITPHGNFIAARESVL